MRKNTLNNQQQNQQNQKNNNQVRGCLYTLPNQSGR